MKNTKPISLHIYVANNEEKRAFAAFAKKQGRTVSGLARFLIYKAIEEDKGR